MRLALAILCMLLALFFGQFHERTDPLRGWLGIGLAFAFLFAGFILSPGGTT